MNKFARTDRVAHLLQREISNIVEHVLLNERIGMTTVTGVTVTRDFKYAKVFVSVLGDQDMIATALETLTNASGFIRSQLNERIILRNIPALSFQYDPSTVNGLHISKLLDDFKNTHS